MDIGVVLFCVFMGRNEVEVHKNAKRNFIQQSGPHAWSITHMFRTAITFRYLDFQWYNLLCHKNTHTIKSYSNFIYTSPFSRWCLCWGGLGWVVPRTVSCNRTFAVCVHWPCLGEEGEGNMVVEGVGLGMHWQLDKMVDLDFAKRLWRKIEIQSIILLLAN